MEMVSNITTLITNVVNFAGGLLLLFGAVTLGTNLELLFADGFVDERGLLAARGRLQAVF